MGNPGFCLNREGTAEAFEAGGGSTHGGPEPQGEGSGQGCAREGSSRFDAVGWTRLRRHDVIATKLRLSSDEKSPVFLPREPDETSNKREEVEKEKEYSSLSRIFIVTDRPSTTRVLYRVSLPQVGYSDCLPTVFFFFPEFLLILLRRNREVR